MPEARAALAAWRDELVAGRPDLRPVPAEALHATLVFLGWAPEKEIDRIAEAALAPVRRLAPARLTPAEVRALPPRRPRLFALDLLDEGGRASALQAAAERALVEGRWHTPEKRPFWPHMTLARVKRAARGEPLAPGSPPPGTFEARDVVLYRSVLRPQGAEYTPLARVTLSG